LSNFEVIVKVMTIRNILVKLYKKALSVLKSYLRTRNARNLSKKAISKM